jgi:regulator of ribonuclease activity A
MKNFTVPDICDTHEDIQIGDIFLNSYGGIDKFCGEIQTAKCEHSNSVVKELVQEDGNEKVLFINHTGSEFCSMVGDQIVQKAFDNNWNGIITNGYIRDIEVIKDIPIGVYAKNSYPKKTNKSIGVGEINAPIKINNISINPGDWIYVDSNGWVISKSELEF